MRNESGLGSSTVLLGGVSWILTTLVFYPSALSSSRPRPRPLGRLPNGASPRPDAASLLLLLLLLLHLDRVHDRIEEASIEWETTLGVVHDGVTELGLRSVLLMSPILYPKRVLSTRQTRLVGKGRPVGTVSRGMGHSHQEWIPPSGSPGRVHKLPDKFPRTETLMCLYQIKGSFELFFFPPQDHPFLTTFPTSLPFPHNLKNHSVNCVLYSGEAK